MDREPPSRSYGAFDRTYWGWKFTDFPGSRFQEALYALSWMYTTPADDNGLLGSALVLEWLQAGFRYWQGLQHKDGSFDEAYPFERSLAATAFTGFYLGEAYLRLGDALAADLRASLQQTFRRAGDWLCRNDEHHGVLSNHLAAAAAALVIIARVTDDARYQTRAQHFIDRILSRQSSEGWYEEYGGADFGYQTHGTFYLARIWALTGDEHLLESLKRSVRFLAVFIHPNGTLGGEYGSRNTSFYFPAGFEILAPVCPEAAAIAAFMRSSVARQQAAGLAMMDAYNFCPLLNNYLFAEDAAQPLDGAPTLPFTTIGHWDFPDAGLVVHATEAYQAVFALSKGGVVKVYDKRSGKLALSDCGYWAEMDDGRRISSQSFSLANKVVREDGRFRVHAPFAQLNQKLMSPLLFLGFRIFTQTVGRQKEIGLKVKALLVKLLVSRRRTVALELERCVQFAPTAVTIEDRVHCTGGEKPRRLVLGSKFSTIHMGSARYFQMDELDSPSLNVDAPDRRTFTWTAP